MHRSFAAKGAAQDDKTLDYSKNETALTFDYFPKITVLEKWELAAM
ncbi:hypothetical protein SBA1_680009 [Candidatus Sulfotelmatobacter kueseliae]|uniref:Uncharacterized protein n=1 Tax=Candidatus Sulfotelmatobacter kueseliae TaxID=2042962 RepID=A0A2U3L4B0_9BACT|nr:hypothetical protein SBA1_680009 [Candidatus Sulfotelmatobacter kueseliae]